VNVLAHFLLLERRRQSEQRRVPRGVRLWLLPRTDIGDEHTPRMAEALFQDLCMTEATREKCQPSRAK